MENARVAFKENELDFFAVVWRDPQNVEIGGFFECLCENVICHRIWPHVVRRPVLNRFANSIERIRDVGDFG